MFGIFSTFSLTLVAGCFLYGANLFFMVVFRGQVYKGAGDGAFKYWARNHKRWVKLWTYLGGALNFKLMRGLYCSWLGFEQFSPSFDDPQVFFRPFTLISTFSILTTMVPLLVGCLCGIIFMDFGYQFTMTCIEITIIEVLLLVLIITEKI